MRYTSLFFVVPILALQWITPAWSEPKSKAATELAQMKSQLETLTRYVKSLESRLAAQEKSNAHAKLPAMSPGEGRAETAIGAPGNDDDPLAEAEAKLGSSRSTPSSPAVRGQEVKASGSATRSKAGSADADPLESAEKDVSVAKSSTPPMGNARTAFNPEISVIGDFVYRNSRLPIDIDVAPDSTTGNLPGDVNRSRFDFRELELSFQAPVDPWTRFDAFIALPGITEEGDTGEQKIEVEEAYATYSRLPWGLQLKGGKFRLEFGKDNLLHTHAFYSVDRPRVIENFLGGEGIRDQGIGLQRQFQLGSPRTLVECTGQLVNSDGEESLFAGTNAHRTMILGKTRLYHEFNDSTNIDLGSSLLDGKHGEHEQLKQRIWGYDLTFRWEPVDQAIYKNLVFRAEYLKAFRELSPVSHYDDSGKLTHREVLGDGWLKPDGFYAMLNYQFQRDMGFGLRYDSTDIARSMAASAEEGVFVPHSRIWGPSVWFTYLPTEFNRFRIQYSHLNTDCPFANGHQGDDMVLLSWTVSMGPHGAHKY